LAGLLVMLFGLLLKDCCFREWAEEGFFTNADKPSAAEERVPGCQELSSVQKQHRILSFCGVLRQDV
jgi:hypothetical protein